LRGTFWAVDFRAVCFVLAINMIIHSQEHNSHFRRDFPI
jgi:hypothetical protein